MSLSAANGSSSIYGTPSRSERLPFPQSSNPSPSPAYTPQRPLATSSTSTSFSTSSVPTSSSSASTVNKDRPLTSSALLRTHAAAQDPKLAALEQAVNDRNVLSAQNAQLWKLIEKQRAGYNQILKELERVRGERDAFKAKLGGTSGAGPSDRRRNEGEKTPKRTFSENQSSGNGESTSSNGDPRHAMTRHNSDDQPTPRSLQHPPLHSSRSHEPLSPRERDNAIHLNSIHSGATNAPRSQMLPPPPSSAPSALNIHSANSANSRSHKPSPSPLIVPPRAENLPVPASAISATQERNPFGSYAHGATSQDYSSSDASDTVQQTSAYPLAANYPRKSSLVDSIGSGINSNTGSSSHTSSMPSINDGAYGSSAPYTPPSQQYHYSGGSTPQTAPPGFGGPALDPPQSLPRTSTTPVVQSQPQILTTPAPQTPPPIIATSTSSTSNGMLSTLIEPRPQALSRESRISLPDEARQYIANMTDSPVPSPRVDAFAAKFGPTSRAVQPIQIPESSPGGLTAPSRTDDAESPGESSEFLDLNEDDDDDDEADDEQSAYTGPEADDDTTDNASLQDTPRQPSVSVPQGEAPQLQAQGRKPKPRAAAEDFPLPPPNTHLQAQQAMSQTQLYQTQAQVHAQAMAAAEAAHHQGSTYPAYVGSEQPSPLENPYSPPGQQQQAQQSMRLEQKQAQQQQQQPQQPVVHSVPANFRALPLLSTDLPHTTITVSHSFVRPNDRGKEVLSFVVYVNPGQGKDGWKVEKMYSDVLGLDQRVRSSVGKGVGKKIASLPEGKLWRDHAPAKVDQRKAVLENYLQTLINLPVKHNDEVIAFFTSDIVRETKQPVMQLGHKEGYLTKRGKNFGGWKTRYFVLQGPVLEYYDCRGGAHLGSITVTGAQIGRQQRSERAPSTDEEKEYRHAFLIVEAKKGPGGNHPRHVLCAESDEDRDSWVEMLVRYFSGNYSEEPVKYGPGPIAVNAAAYQNGTAGQPRTSTSSADSPSSRRPTRAFPKDDISISKGAAVPISQLPPDHPSNAKLFQPPAPLAADDYARSSSPAKSIEPSPTDRQGAGSMFDGQNYNARRIMERGQGQPSSLPDSSPLSSVPNFHAEPIGGLGQRANSELGHYTDMQGHGRPHRQISPERHRTRDPHEGRKSFYPTLNAVASSPTAASPIDRIPSPDKLDANGKVKISGPLNGAPIPSGFKFGGKDAPSASESSAAERREKAKSRSFWGFGKMNATQPTVTFIPRAVFGVALEESLDVAQIANLPAIVFRSIQYLEAKKAEQEEGIYRLSGSSAVIKSLKDRFNQEGDVDLLASDEYWDPHAIAGLLKSFLRELPASILTRDLHLRFLAVIDFVDAQERIKELSQLIAALPITNYSLLRALTAHLILIVQNSSINKMTMRNVGIVFSPTLGIPAGVFSLMLGEFNRVFNVDADTEEGERETGEDGDEASDMHRRNSRQYSDAAADQLLGLTGRTLKTSAEEAPSDGDDISVLEESGTETNDDFTMESSSDSSPGPGSQQNDHAIRVTPPDTPIASKTSRASNVAATRGLNVSVTQSERGNRHSKMLGLPSSPRPPPSPSRPEVPPSPSLTRND
ncbi:hypothetical protein Hypma_011957 [Hypsizygus marmoreus]|uniref:RhoGAP-domain-containing protein n=1 Tax=Hypsizygus marmoreus TaxID=39966 RepID=A0A369JFK5_HYPMA|nr:hypothetical protein Hypma_011957 [Hypsizygus marmoreus]